MFSNFSERVLKTFDGLLSRGVLTENDVNSAMREIRVALLEADVPLNIAKEFVEKVKEGLDAYGQCRLGDALTRYGALA